MAMRFFVVSDSHEECPYLPGQTARLPLRMPLTALSADEFDALLADGDRRFGPFLYRTTCPSCDACEPIRVPIGRFQPTRSQARALKKNPDVDVRVLAPEVTRRHLEIYNRHQLERGLSRTSEPIGEAEYRLHLVQSCVETREVRYLVDGRMVALSILDLGRTAASSVYHAFDPDYSARSLGVFSVLKEIALCKERGMKWYYLGLYVKDCRRLSYKAQYYPHERRIAGAWREYTAPAASSSGA
jgi:arginine-tRNA-protein transferase